MSASDSPPEESPRPISKEKRALLEEKETPYSVADVLIDEEQYIKAWIGEKGLGDPKKVTLDKEHVGEEPATLPLPMRFSDPKADPRFVIPKLVEFRKNRGERELQRDALCLSGGGIRSACISLGVVQGLAGRKLLRNFHYLSTVSGGGYLGSWLSTWIKTLRTPGYVGNVHELESLMAESVDGVEVAEIRNLRTNSNFLTPRTGALSVDLFACLTIVARNMIVNWLVLIPFFALCLAASMIILLLGSRLIDDHGDATWIGIAAVVFLGLNAVIALGVMPIFSRAQKKGAQFGKMSFEYRAWMVCRWGCTLCASFAMAIWFYHLKAMGDASFILGYAPKDTKYLTYLPLYGFILVPYLIGMLRALVWHRKASVKHSIGKTILFGAQALLAFVVSLALSYTAARGFIALSCPVPQIVMLFFHPVTALFRHTLYLTFSPAIWLLIIELQNFLIIGCLSMVTTDEDREWWSRSNAVTILLGLGWFVTCLTTVCGPALSFLFALHEKALFAALLSQFSLGGILALMSSSAKTPATAQDKPAPIRLNLLQVGGIVFFVFLAMLVATANYRIAVSLQPPPPDAPSAASTTEVKTPGSADADQSWRVLKSDLSNAPPIAPIRYWLRLAGLAFFFTAASSLVININQFSLQCLYRNRLMRCFVGAVRRAQPATKPPEYEPFTGFDTTDNYEVSSLRFQLPFHVINCAQNLIKTTNLAWQQRMACSFTVSPLHTGGEITGYRTTQNFGADISIGTAIATSGAAANPSMGHATSPILELLMGLFNVRLGWWVGNPNSKKRWRDLGPRLAFQPLLSEMFGQTSEGQDYVLLSDGGHFEDLAVYEMIQRRCRFLLVVDGGADPTGNFEDLGNCVRKVRIDLGVEIDFFFNRTTPNLADTVVKRQHFAVAKILYSKTDKTKPELDGWLLYIKCNLNGDESQDIYQYKQFYDDFPHQTTMDQWFDESQFESYRALGRHSLERTLAALEAYGSWKHFFREDPAPGAITDEELGPRKMDFKAFLEFMRDRKFIS